ncbi:hypothetical protein [Marinactinospora rubrisoli]|uniref:Uncharacterized protein n=1 Tax=Marinactinospora rubrisoli TaxID=2715399 RepID=A0ABW2KDK4_9ACTN
MKRPEKSSPPPWKDPPDAAPVGGSTSVNDLENALQVGIGNRDENPRPVVWTTTAAAIFPTNTAYLHRLNDSDHQGARHDRVIDSA